MPRQPQNLADHLHHMSPLQECIGKLSATQENTSTVITVTQIGGLFILHAAIAFVCLCGFVMTWGAAKITQARNGTHGESRSSASVHPAEPAAPVVLLIDAKKEGRSTDSKSMEKVVAQESWV